MSLGYVAIVSEGQLGLTVSRAVRPFSYSPIYYYYNTVTSTEDLQQHVLQP